MPLPISLAASGSHSRFLRCRTRLPRQRQPPRPFVASQPLASKWLADTRNYTLVHVASSLQRSRSANSSNTHAATSKKTETLSRRPPGPPRPRIRFVDRNFESLAKLESLRSKLQDAQKHTPMRVSHRLPRLKSANSSNVRTVTGKKPPNPDPKSKSQAARKHTPVHVANSPLRSKSTNSSNVRTVIGKKPKPKPKSKSQDARKHTSVHVANGSNARAATGRKTETKSKTQGVRRKTQGKEGKKQGKGSKKQSKGSKKQGKGGKKQDTATLPHGQADRSAGAAGRQDPVHVANSSKARAATSKKTKAKAKSKSQDATRKTAKSKHDVSTRKNTALGDDAEEEIDRLMDEAEDDVLSEELSAPHLGTQTRKRNRTSRATGVLDSIRNSSRNLYRTSNTKKPGSSSTDKLSRRPLKPEPEEPLSLYSIVSRQLQILTEGAAAPGGMKREQFLLHKNSHGDKTWEDTHVLTVWRMEELAILRRYGYSTDHVNMWTTCLLTHDSIPASAAFSHGRLGPPLFVLLLFLRRNRIRAFALGVIMRYVGPRMEAGSMDWSSLRLLAIRLLRHARLAWPEAIPTIVSYFCTGANRMNDRIYQQMPSTRFMRSLTRFCNNLLALIAHPVPESPFVAGIHQEEAQFALLNFMANFNPALVVTRHGFRAVVRNQLTHAKTAKEREWASLKGPSWPPWKENRHAMDEDKDYMWAASRASRILHRLFEAGYAGRKWEALAEIYAGWDVDLSPTIQTRVLLPQSVTGFERGAVDAMMWAARVRTTRTRREAWACFLAYEDGGVRAHNEVYLAMFEKITNSEIIQEPEAEKEQTEMLDGSTTPALVPGDTKNVFPDPHSPLHLVHLSEPVPSHADLYNRMRRKGLRPTKRLLAFLLDTLDDFDACLNLLKDSKNRWRGGVGNLFHNEFRQHKTPPVPNYFFAAFIRFLCRFSRVTKPPSDQPHQLSSTQHDDRMANDRAYLIDYAHTLLLHFRPTYRPPWTAYMRAVIYGHNKKRSAYDQYTTLRAILAEFQTTHTDLDDEQFQLLCTVVRYAAQAVYKWNLPPERAQDILDTAPSLLRAHFHNLVGANVGPGAPRSAAPSRSSMHAATLHQAPASAPAVPQDQPQSKLRPHIPSPAALHLYVRALGFLRDFEGLYSFSSWMTTYHKEVSVRALANHGGPSNLYRTLLALRAGLEGTLDARNRHGGASAEIRELVRAQVESVRGWKWPGDGHVEAYVGMDPKGWGAGAR